MIGLSGEATLDPAQVRPSLQPRDDPPPGNTISRATSRHECPRWLPCWRRSCNRRPQDRHRLRHRGAAGVRPPAVSTKQKVDRLVVAVDRAIQVLPLAADFDVGVSRPRGFHPKPLAEPCVNLSIYTAPVIQPWPHETAGVRTAAAVLPSPFATTPHRGACGVAASCICAEPSAQAFGLDTDRARAWLIDRKRRSSSTTLVSWDCSRAGIHTNPHGTVDRESVRSGA